MILEEYIKSLQQKEKITTVSKSISINLEIAGVLKTLEPTPVLFEDVKESQFRVAGNLFCNKEQVSDYFGISIEDIIPTLTKAIENRSKPEETDKAPCQEVVEENVDLEHEPGFRRDVLGEGAVPPAQEKEGGQRTPDIAAEI